MSGKMRAIGLMSGTSMDGIDAAILETDGTNIFGFGKTHFRPYSDAERKVLQSAVARAAGLTSRRLNDAVFHEAEALVTQAHIDAVQSLRQRLDANEEKIDVVGFHGQTILHRPQAGLTIQLGDGDALSAATGLKVVYDFRAADVAAGGEGAPFVPVYHRALANHAALDKPVVFVNIGGVANVTWIDSDGDMLAFDTGPGNALLDDWMMRNTGASMDVDGAAARAGRADPAVLAALMANDYFAQKPPKSLDRNAFDISALDGLTVNDGAAILVAFTVETILAAAQHFPDAPKCWIIVGGGTQNPAIMTALKARISARVDAATQFGWMPDFIEAQAFAFLAVRHLNGQPLTYPGTTGVKSAMPGGRMSRSVDSRGNMQL
ncbi:MAG: anhydro-N-acetylmuramic acid kinase [Fimbriimonadaceae bacterium]|nr:anhydro-N-acetylmuramic acid kinase [Alphaproteobacteria bacterium]